MSDHEFDGFDFGEMADDPATRIVEEEDEETENRENQRRNLSMAMTQKLYGRQGASTTVEYDDNEYVKPRNKFEEILEQESVRIAIDEDLEKCVIFGGQMNHEDFRRNMEKRMMKDRDLRVFDEFVMACNSDPHFLQLYLSPAKSKLGLQDTILRAFLMIKQSQTKAFIFVLEKLNILAKRTDQADLLLAQTCVAHMRHLNRLFEPLSVFNTMFEFPFRFWSPNVREDLIEALPEIFTDPHLQKSTAVRLNQEILETQDIQELPSFQMAIIETLRLLRMDTAVGRQIRMNLVNLCMQIDVSCLPNLVAFCLSSLISGPGVKNDDEEVHFHEMLREMSKILKIDVIKKKTSKADSIICDVFSHFLRFLQLDKKGWKYITSWVTRSKADKLISDETTTEGDDEDRKEKQKEEEESASASWMNTFETMLVLSLLSSSDCCPSTFVAAVNSRMLNIPLAASNKFLKLVDLVISFKKFSSAHLNALIHVGKQYFWSTDANIRKVGVNVYKHLFTGMERKDRAKVFNELMKHFSQSELECEAVLDVFSKTIKSHVAVILEFSAQIQKCLEHLQNLSISNIKRLFQVLLLISAADKTHGKCEIDEIINRFLISVSEREKFLGILALLMKIQVEMNKKHTENQETNIRAGIERIEGAVNSSPNLRGAFYEHMRIVVENHKRLEEIRFFNGWTDVLMTRFKNRFFQENSEETMEEGSTKWILNPKADRLVEVVPMFNLIKELLVLRMRWREEDDDSIRSSYDVCVIKDLNFAFESLVSLDSEGSAKDSKLNHLFFLVQWTRTVLNAFLAQSSIDFLSSEEVSKLATKMFYLMMDSEKKLQGSLASVALWKVPNLKFEKKEDAIVGKVEKKKAGKGRPKKRKSDESIVEADPNDTEVVAPEEGNEEGDIDIVKETSPSLTNQLRIQFVQLKLRPIVHLMKLTKTKRSCLVYLCDELQAVLDSLVKMKKKTIPMLAARSLTPQVDKLYHGDSVTIWFCIKKAVEQVWSIVDLVFDFFSGLPDSSQEVNAKLQKDLEELGHKSLALMHTILSGELYGNEEKLTPTEKRERRSVLVRIIEKRMNEAENLSNDPEQARVVVAQYLVKVAEFAPTPAVAVAILDVFEDMKIDEDEEGDLRKSMAKYALAYLKKDWSKVDEVWNKGPKFTTAVRDILSHYIKLRKDRDQLLAIQWILTNKVVQLVPDEEKRKSCVFSQHSDDDLLEKEDKKTLFHCITKSTFGVIFKTLFSCLNSCANRREMSATAVKNGLVDAEESLEAWELASSCFLILCLLLRVHKIRTTAVLTTAVREGKQFLITVSKKSSFIHLMDNITKENNFEVVSKKIEKILSAVQQGNRVLQSIGTYAKTSKCVLLLKKFPELRAESENCLRVIHSAMVKNECLNAFTVGLVKSRSIDGEIITEDRESSEESDED